MTCTFHQLAPARLLGLVHFPREGNQARHKGDIFTCIGGLGGFKGDLLPFVKKQGELLLGKPRRWILKAHRNRPIAALSAVAIRCRAGCPLSPTPLTWQAGHRMSKIV
ncbi:MAG: hypothetical protein ACFFCS_11715 [Candidatus Hodarchaeota archaeon]